MAESKQPRFVFSTDENEQKEQLKTNVLMEQFRQYRAKNKDDLFYPAYHFWAPDGAINDPNGFCRWKDKYHLFYQQYPPVNLVEHWGHAVSDDMVHWEDLPTAIYPDIEKACFSGNALVEEDRVIAMYHGFGLGNMIATASDPLLLNWEKNPNNPVIPHLSGADAINPAYCVYDPFIWKEDDGYYSLSGSSLTQHLYFSQNLDKWTYLGHLMDSNPFVEVPNDGACPYFLPFGDDENQRILFFYSHSSGTRALIGTYDKVIHKFTPKKSITFSYDPFGFSSMIAPCAISDGNGGVYVIYNLRTTLKERIKWGIFTLVRHITTDAEGNIWIKPAKEHESLRQKLLLDESLTLTQGKEAVLNAKGKCLEINAEIDMTKARSVEFNVLCDTEKKEYTTISITKGRSSIPYGYVTVDTTHSSVYPPLYGQSPESMRFEWNKENKINVRIYVDKCMVEVFVNDRAALPQLTYTALPESDRVTVEALGSDAVIEKLTVFELGSIY